MKHQAGKKCTGVILALVMTLSIVTTIVLVSSVPPINRR